MYYNLHSHTQYSNTRLLDCIIKEEDLIDKAHELGLSGIAITDHEILSSHVRAQKHIAKRKKENPEDKSWQDFKLILGNEIYLCRNGLTELNFVKGQDYFYHFILLALDDIGHKQLRELSTRAFKHSWFRNMRRVPTYYSDIEEIIGANPGHVWGSSACIGGYFGRKMLENTTESIYNAGLFLDWANKTFNGYFSLEMQPSSEKDQIKVNNFVIEEATRLNIPYIITTDAHYLRPEDRKIHKAFLNSKGGERETEGFYSTTFLMSEEEIYQYMKGNFKFHEGEYIKKGLDNTCMIANLVKEYSLIKETKLPYMPLELLSRPINFFSNEMKNLMIFFNSEEEADRQLAYKIINFIQTNPNADLERIEIELKSIITSDEKMNMKWAKYLLQVADYIKIFWEEGDTLVGPARGSGGGFYINYILGISQIDPTREKARCYPWRFLNPERASLLDIDTDIQGNRRNKCIRALKNKYGDFRAIEVATFGTEKAKSAIKTACLKPGTLVNTDTGLKAIENITNTDYVYTTNGLEKVVTPTYRNYNGELYSFNISGAGMPLSVTNNHQLLVYTNRTKLEKDNCQNYKECQLLDSNHNVLGTFTSIKSAAKYYASTHHGSFSSMYKYKQANGYSIVENPVVKNHSIQWLTAEDIEPSDYLLTPIYNNDNNSNYSDYINFSREEQNPYKKSINYINDIILLNEEFCELVGIYLAEGSVRKNGVTFSIHQEEEWLKNRIIYLLNSVFGVKKENIGYYIKPNNLGVSIEVHSTPLKRFFNKYFHGKAHTKSIGLVKYLPASSQIYTLYGCYYGDGYGRKRENGSYEGKITSVSYQLITELWQIAANNHYNCPIITEDRQSLVYNLMFYGQTAKSLYESKYLNQFNLDWEKEDYLTHEGINYYPIKIKSITKQPYSGKVYCLETPSHNYLLNNIVSHNCRGLDIDVDIATYITSFIESERGIQRTLTQTFEGDEENDIKPNAQFRKLMIEDYPQVWEVAKKIEGLVSRIGKHAGGVVITDEDITERAAIMTTNKDEFVSQYELHDLEDLGRFMIRPNKILNCLSAA